LENKNVKAVWTEQDGRDCRYILQYLDGGKWADFATIHDRQDAMLAVQYCKKGAEAWRFGKFIPAKQFRIVRFGNGWPVVDLEIEN
jgi:hypothetical protein